MIWYEELNHRFFVKIILETACFSLNTGIFF